MQRVETQVTETMAPSVQRTETITAETYREMQERDRRMDLHMRKVSDSVETQGGILLNIREMLHGLLSNNDCKSLSGRIGFSN